MKKVFLLVAAFPGSIISFRGALMEALCEAGWEVHVAAPGLEGDKLIFRELVDKGVTPHDISLHRTGMNPFQDFCTFISLARLMLHVRPQCVMGYTIKPVIYGLLAAWLIRVPRRYALITGLGYAFQDEEQNSFLLRLVRKFYRVSLSRAHKVFFQNPDDESLFRSLNILSSCTPSQIVNGSGVETAQFMVTPFPEAPLRFLLIARLIKDKGIREYVQAAQIVREQHPEVRFSLVGWLDENPNVISQRELDEWISSGTIDYLGRLDDVRPAIANAGVYVLPSYREGTPRTVLEAMAMGRAIITTDAPGCRETVVHGDNGHLVPVKDSQALAAAMIQFIEQPELVVRMGKRSREIAEEKYDVHKVNKVMLQEMGIQ